jgi:hypothetical protein
MLTNPHIGAKSSVAMDMSVNASDRYTSHINSGMYFDYYTPAPRRGRGVYCFTSFRPSKIFFVTFFSVTVDDRNLINCSEEIFSLYSNLIIWVLKHLNAVQSFLFMQSFLLSSHLYLKVTFSCPVSKACTNKFDIFRQCT